MTKRHFSIIGWRGTSLRLPTRDTPRGYTVYKNSAICQYIIDEPKGKTQWEKRKKKDTTYVLMSRRTYHQLEEKEKNDQG